MEITPEKGRLPPLLRDRVMWLGFGLAAAHNLLNIGQAFNPYVPAAGRYVDIGAMLVQPPCTSRLRLILPVPLSRFPCCCRGTDVLARDGREMGLSIPIISLIGTEGLAGFFTCDAAGNTAFYQAFDAGGNAVAPEDIEIVPPCENFYGVNHPFQIMGAHSSQFASMVGDIVVAQELPGILWRIQWTGAGFLATQLAAVSQWEHITFSPASIGPIPPPDDNTPPTAVCGLTTTMLWPPNHNLVNVGFSLSVKDNCAPQPDRLGRRLRR